MENIFDTIFTTDSSGNLTMTVATFFIMAGVALASGIIFAWIMSFRVRSNKRFFIVNAILPVLIACIIGFVNGNIGVGVAVGGAFALIRFRSAQSTADELASVLITMAGGVAFGTGYVAYGVLIMVGVGLLYFGISMLPIWKHKSFAEEKLLKITIPESLDYSEVFNETFSHYLKENELVGVKTTNMGSMFKLSFRIKMKNPKEEKELIDELRTMNGNLEISLLPYVEANNTL